MKRSTLVTLGVLAALAAVYAAKSFKSTEQGPPPLSIDGYVGNVSEADARDAQKDKLPPVKKITVKKKGDEIVLDQIAQELPKDATPDKAKPVEAKWSARRTFKGKSTEAKAQVYRANAMADVFARTIRSTFARVAKAEALAEYGLDADHAIDVEAVLDSRTVKLRIGNLDKGQELGDATTWVQDPARPDVVYQVAGRDLRGAFDVPWSDIRDKSLLALELSAVDRIEVDNPGDPRQPRFAVKRPPLTDAQRKDLADKKPGRDAGEGWAVAEPAGFGAGDVGDWLKSIERMSANEFLDPAEVADKKADTGLDDAKVAAKVTVTAGDKKTVIVFAKTDEASASKDVWARIEGRDEVYKVASYTRDQVLLKFDQVRDRSLLGARKAASARSFKVTGPDGAVDAVKTAAGWQIAGMAHPVSAKAIDSFLSDLDGVKVDFAADVTPGSAGLASAEWTLSIQFDSGAVAVQLAKEADGNALGRVDAPGPAGDVWKLASWSAGKLRKTAKDFEDKRVLPFAKDEATRIKVALKDGTPFELTRSGDKWTVAEGGHSVDGKADAVAAWLTTLADLEFANAADKGTAELGLDKDFGLIEVSNAGGKTWSLRISGQKSGEEPYIASLRDGKVARVATLASWAASNLTKKASDFAATP